MTRRNIELGGSLWMDGPGTRSGQRVAGAPTVTAIAKTPTKREVARWGPVVGRLCCQSRNNPKRPLWASVPGERKARPKCLLSENPKTPGQNSAEAESQAVSQTFTTY